MGVIMVKRLKMYYQETCVFLILDIPSSPAHLGLTVHFGSNVLYYLLMSRSLTLKTTIPRMTRTGIKAYRIRKFVVNLDVAPGQVLSMN